MNNYEINKIIILFCDDEKIGYTYTQQEADEICINNPTIQWSFANKIFNNINEIKQFLSNHEQITIHTRIDVNKWPPSENQIFNLAKSALSKSEKKRSQNISILG